MKRLAEPKWPLTIDSSSVNMKELLNNVYIFNVKVIKINPGHERVYNKGLEYYCIQYSTVH